MSKKIIPSLSLAGWIEDDEKILDYLFSYYILTDQAQSLLFSNNLYSLSHIYYRNINNPTNFASELKTNFTSYLEYYFPIVETFTEVKQLKNEEYGILLSASVITEEGKKLSLTNITKMSTSSSREIIKVNNYGSGQEYLNSL